MYHVFLLAKKDITHGMQTQIIRLKHQTDAARNITLMEYILKHHPIKIKQTNTAKQINQTDAARTKTTNRPHIVSHDNISGEYINITSYKNTTAYITDDISEYTERIYRENIVCITLFAL